MFDSQLGWLANVAGNYLISGKMPKRYGNAHANIVPYQSFRASDKYFVVTVGNDKQFARLCELMSRADLAADTRFATNNERVIHREELIPILQSAFSAKPAAHWLSVLEAAEIPCSPINSLDKIFSMTHVSARAMLVHMEHPTIEDLTLVGSPLKMSDTSVEYRLPPPLKGEHTAAALEELLGYSSSRAGELKARGVI